MKITMENTDCQVRIPIHNQKYTNRGASILRTSLHWRHKDHYGVSNHQPHGCLLNRLFRRRSKETSKLRVTGLCEGNSPGTGEFPAQRASNAENVSIWWRHHDSQRDKTCLVIISVTKAPLGAHASNSPCMFYHGNLTALTGWTPFFQSLCRAIQIKSAILNGMAYKGYHVTNTIFGRQ